MARARDVKGRRGNTAMSAESSKNVDTDFIQKPFLLTTANGHKGVIVQTWIEDTDM